MAVEGEPVRVVSEAKLRRDGMSPDEGAGQPATGTEEAAWLLRPMRELDMRLRCWVARIEACDGRVGPFGFL